MRYLVTGGAGFVGSHLVDALVVRGDEVVVLDDLSTGSLANLGPTGLRPSVTVVRGSTVDGRLVRELMADCDACLHLASAVGVALIVERALESLLSNVRGTDVVLEQAARLGRPVLYTSTSEIYGRHDGHVLGEGDDRLLGSPSVARWSYAISKEFGEAAAMAYHREHGLRATVVRLFNVVGARQSAQYGMVLPRFVGQALAGDDLTVYGDGLQSRCFLHVGDAVRALVALLDEPAAAGGTFNVGSPHAVRINDLAELVRERAGSTSRIRHVPYDEAYGDGFVELGLRRPDISAIRALVGWKPELPLLAAVDDLIRSQGGRAGAPERAAADAA